MGRDVQKCTYMWITVNFLKHTQTHACTSHTWKTSGSLFKTDNKMVTEII